MTYETQSPTVTREDEGTGRERTVFNHPAFGRIVVTKPTGGGFELFGSALKHQTMVCVKIETASLQRELNHDWISGGKYVTEFYMSESQWSHFVSSAGDGGGTPITFRIRHGDDGKLMKCPGIESNESMKQTYKREVRELCEEKLAEAVDLVEELKGLVAAGKANKGQLASVLGKAAQFSERLPGTMAFIQGSFAETMEKTVEAGKTEMEAFVHNLAHRTGLEVLRQQSVTLLESKNNKEDDHAA